MAFPTWNEMKPETQKRIKAERGNDKIKRAADLTTRLRSKAAEHGPESIWAEMLAEREAANA